MENTPPPLPRPKEPAPTPEQLKRDIHLKQLRISYGLVFESEHGKKVLADLKENFGWSGEVENPSAVPGLRSEEVWLREGLKQPVRHILKKLQPAANNEPTRMETATQ